MPDSAASVLIVEDERIVARDLQRTLLGFGYDAFAIAASCEEALAAAEEKTPAVVLMDIRIKGAIDGIATARMLRERFASMVVYLTAHADPDTLQRATATDPSGYLQKPVRPAELRSAIEISLHKRRAEARWRDRGRWIGSALEALEDAVIAIDPSGEILEINRVASRWLGRPAEELRGLSLTEALAAVAPQSGDTIPEAAARALSDGGEHRGRGALAAALGGGRSFDYRVQVVRAADDVRVLGALLIMTESPRPAAVTDDDASFRALIDRAPVGVLVHRDGKFIYVNDAFARALGYDRPSELIGMPVLDTVHPDARRVVLERMRKVATAGRGTPTEVPALRPDGSVVYFEGSGFALMFQGALATVAVMQDITARRAVDAALQESEARYRHLFRESPVSLWEGDMSEVRTFLDTVAARGISDLRAELTAHPELVSEAVRRVKIIDVNDATLAMYGASTRQELQQKLLDLFVPETYRQFVDCLCFLWEGKGGTLATQSAALNLQGERRDIDLRLTVAPGAEQSWSRVLFSLFDTTASKATEHELRVSLREKDVLLKEVHHRVKNNLQVISSLLNLQAMQMLDPDVRRQLSESQNRVQVIALVHEQLYRSKDLSHIDFGDYTHALVNDLRYAHDADERGLQVTICMDDVRLGVDAAIPCGLMLNELVTNAMKHAFPGSRPGSIEIRFERTAGILTLSVADDGVGLPPGLELERASTLGLDLVSTFADQLEAEVTVDRSAGTRFSISFAEK